MDDEAVKEVTAVGIILVGEPEQNTINTDAVFQVAIRGGNDWPEGVLLRCVLDGGAQQAITPPGSGAASIPYIGLVAGVHHWECYSDDGVGNVSEPIVVEWDIVA